MCMRAHVRAQLSCLETALNARVNFTSRKMLHVGATHIPVRVSHTWCHAGVARTRQPISGRLSDPVTLGQRRDVTPW